MEMGASQLALRMVGSLGRIDQQHLRTGALRDDEWGRLSEAVEKLGKVSLFIDESGSLSPTELRARARRQARQCGQLGLIVVDYLQLMSGSDGTSEENRATVIGEISRALKSLAKELKCPVIALSQLNRSVESRTDKRPLMSDLRESGAIEQDADVIMFIYRDEYYNQGRVQGAGDRRDHHRQAAQRPDRHLQADVPEAADQVRQPRSRIGRQRLLSRMTHARAVAAMVAATLLWSMAGVVSRQLDSATELRGDVLAQRLQRRGADRPARPAARLRAPSPGRCAATT